MPKSKREQSSREAASAAGRVLRNPKSTKDDKKAAASALTQARDKKRKRK